MREMQKLGTVEVGLAETTPIVFKDRLCRLESWHNQCRRNPANDNYHCVVDVAGGQVLARFAEDGFIGSAFVDGDVLYVFAVNKGGGDTMLAYQSQDLESWSSHVAFSLPGWKIWNNSVCKGPDGYVMAFEISAPPQETGHPFTTRFAGSADLLKWELTPPECVHDKSRYTACPTIHFFDGFYYMAYLACRQLKGLPGEWYQFETCLARSRDLVQWQESPLNPILAPSAEDKLIASEQITDEERGLISRAVNSNNSDIDYCEFEGRTFIYYNWGDQGQHGNPQHFLAHAFYDGTLQEWLESCYPEG